MSSNLPQLRDYQEQAIADVQAAFTRTDRVLLQMPTGAGKTITFARLARLAVAAGQRVLIIAHREELLSQASDKLHRETGLTPGLIQGGRKADYTASLQVAGIQSLTRRLAYLQPPDLIVIDEAHHCTSSSYLKVLDQYPDARVLGVTATPARTDKNGFDHIFDELVTGPTVKWLIEHGYLSRFKVFADPQPMQTAGARRTMGDYSIHDLADLNDAITLSGNLVESYRRYADGLKNIIFALNVEHSIAIAERFNAAGIPARHLDGTSSREDREGTLAAFRAGDIRVLSNCMLFTEGFDVPDAACCQIARPTASLGLHLQMLGRVLRVAEDKPYSVIIDHTSNWTKGLPDSHFEWTLEAPPKGEPPALQRGESGEIIPAPPRPQAVEVEAQLVEVANLDGDALTAWRGIWQYLVDVQQSRGYKKSWLMFQLQKERDVPLEVWRWCAHALGCKSGWAFYRWRDQNAA
ncbi:DEAD/DEAH box helicase [Nodosilinea sp. AN01ver1]|uniref:DEAD/DEAH box helicase n=1 Tax=Nodosilinea sp. AN01ver1 TaxID=3423362 RepID=UPI003D315270